MPGCFYIHSNTWSLVNYETTSGNGRLALALHTHGAPSMDQKKRYNYKNCQSLFGYSTEVHIRCSGRCQLCGCGGEPLDFDLWRQMTVEHLIGKSQGGYIKEVREEVRRKFPSYSGVEVESLAREIDALNTVTACQFCNSTTSRFKSRVSMYELILSSEPTRESIIQNATTVCNEALKEKQSAVKWKIESVKEAFDDLVASRIQAY